MRLLNKLTITNLKQNRRRTIMTIIGIMLSVALITSIANLYVSAAESLITHTKHKTGDFHYGFKNASKEKIEKLRQSRDVEKIYILNQEEELVLLKEDVQIENIDIFVRYTKEALREQTKVNKADFVNMELIELERGLFFNDNLEANTLVNSAIIVMCMIMLTSIMCIKNSFDISISERIRQYGMLVSVGATRIQIRKNVYYEATVLAIFGVPFGLILGIVISYALIRICEILFKDFLVFELIYAFSFPAAIVAIILSILTIYLSARYSAKKASKVTPIQAIRNQNSIKINKDYLHMPKWIRKTLGIGGEVAYKNLQRSKQKYKTTIISLVMCVSLFIAVSSFVSIGFQRLAIRYNDNAYNLSIGYLSPGENKLSQYLEDISKLKEVEHKTYYRVGAFSIRDEETTDDCKKYAPNYNIKDEMTIGTVVIDDLSFKEYAEHLQLKYDKVKDKGILYNTIYVEYRESIVKTTYLNVEEGDMIDGEALIWDSKESKYIGLPYQIPIAKITEELPRGREWDRGSCIILNESTYKGMIDEDNAMEWIYIQSKNPGKTEEEIKTLLGNLINEANTFYLTNLEEQEKENLSFYTLVGSFLYSLITVIASIGITNMFNIISANMNLRKREFAMLTSIGMTSKEFNRMILLEGLFYGRAALVIGIPLGIALSYLLYGSLEYESYYVPYQIPVKSVLISAIAVILLIIGIMKYSLSKINKKNIIETVREENI